MTILTSKYIYNQALSSNSDCAINRTSSSICTTSTSSQPAIHITPFQAPRIMQPAWPNMASKPIFKEDCYGNKEWLWVQTRYIWLPDCECICNGLLLVLAEDSCYTLYAWIWECWQRENWIKVCWLTICTLFAYTLLIHGAVLLMPISPWRDNVICTPVIQKEMCEVCSQWLL